MLDVDNLITQDGTALKRNANWQWNMNGLPIYNVQAHTSMHMRTHAHIYTCAHAHMHAASTNAHTHSQTSGGPMPYTSRCLHVVSSDDVQSQGHLLHAWRGRVDTLMALIQNDIDSLVKPLQLSLKGKRRCAVSHLHTYVHSMGYKEMLQAVWQCLDHALVNQACASEGRCMLCNMVSALLKQYKGKQ